MPRATPPDVRERGQHFLTGAPSAVRRMVEAAAIRPGESVLDVGAGRGEFTQLLSEAVGPTGRVLSVELDVAMARRLAERAPRNVQVVQGDALQAELPARLDAVVSNPPYRILPPLLVRLLDHGFGRAVLVMPRELVTRLKAPAGSPAYGRLTIEMGMRATTEALFSVPRRAFEPAPAVASSVATVEPRPFPLLDAEGRLMLGKVLDIVLESRQRTNRYAFAPVAAALRVSTETVVSALTALRMTNRKPLDVTPQEYAQFVELMRPKSLE